MKRGISPETLGKINGLIEQMFHGLSVQFLGEIPQLSKKKRIVFSTNENNLAFMFFSALGNVKPNEMEEEIFRTVISSANDYINSLKEKTKAQVSNSITGYYQEKMISGEEVEPDDLRGIIKEGIDKSKNHFEMIVNAESKNIRNMGNMLKISRMAAERGVKRPIVYFHPLLDGRNDPETFRLHLLPDRLTPRLWYLDELECKYHKKGDKYPKVQGTSPNCRCILTPYVQGYTFNENGHIQFKSLEHNELEDQRKIYEMP